MDIEILVEALESCDEEKLIELWNEYCDVNHYEEKIFTNDEEFINNTFNGDVIKALKATADSYSYEDDYAWVDGRGWVCSCCDLIENPIYLGDLAIWLSRRKDEEELKILLNMEDY